MSSNSVCNHTRDKQIGLPLRGRPILLITRLITDRIGLHSVLLPLFITNGRRKGVFGTKKSSYIAGKRMKNQFRNPSGSETISNVP